MNERLLSKIKAPCVISVGDEDNMVSQTETESLCSYIPEAKFKLHNQTKHPIEKLQIDLLKSELEEFLFDI